MTPENLFDIAHPVREDQYEDSTSGDYNKNTGRTTEATIIEKTTPLPDEPILQQFISNYQGSMLCNAGFTDFKIRF